MRGSTTSNFDDGHEAEEILLGLTREKKALPSKLLYDAAGSELFQRITELPEYYLTRTEKKLLGERAADIVAAVPFEAGRGRHWWNSARAMRLKRSCCSMPRRVDFPRISRSISLRAYSGPSARVCR